MARVVPEIDKKRRVVVISPRSYNQRHGNGPGRCLVIPFSATAPHKITPAHVVFDGKTYKCLSEPTWALCDVVTSVSHARLNNVQIGGVNQFEDISDTDMARLEAGLTHSLGLADTVS
jgi:uncharacterized protein YifN (PemK superfamily)